jgi:hypothetical protein
MVVAPELVLHGDVLQTVQYPNGEPPFNIADAYPGLEADHVQPSASLAHGYDIYLIDNAARAQYQAATGVEVLSVGDHVTVVVERGQEVAVSALLPGDIMVWALVGSGPDPSSLVLTQYGGGLVVDEVLAPDESTPGDNGGFYQRIRLAEGPGRDSFASATSQDVSGPVYFGVYSNWTITVVRIPEPPVDPSVTVDQVTIAYSDGTVGVYPRDHEEGPSEPQEPQEPQPVVFDDSKGYIGSSFFGDTEAGATFTFTVLNEGGTPPPTATAKITPLMVVEAINNMLAANGWPLAQFVGTPVHQPLNQLPS